MCVQAVDQGRLTDGGACHIVPGCALRLVAIVHRRAVERVPKLERITMLDLKTTVDNLARVKVAIANR